MLSDRALNRSLLARQGLLERRPVPPESALEELAGLQAQEQIDPYLALWSRIEAFDPTGLSTQIEDGRAVRAGLMRATIHLVTARDHDALQPVMGDVLRRTFKSQFAKTLVDAPVEEVVAAARGMFPATRVELAARLAPLFPQSPAASLAHAAVHHLPLVQVPPRGLWGRGGQARWALREPAPPPATVDEIVLRYLAAFGPASNADLRTWCNLTGLRAVVDRLRPSLVVVRDAAGRELLDVPGAPYPDEDVPAPPRFLPVYDNVWLSHENRARIIPPGTGWEQPTGAARRGALLVDGFVRGPWSIEEDVLTVHRGPPSDEIITEGEALVRFLFPGADPRVVFN